MNQSVKRYLSKIGQIGGRKSRRTLSSQEAVRMVRVREARRAFRKHYSQCFWSYDPRYKVTQKDIQWVGEQLLKYGGMEVWDLGNKLCQ
jgi:hypothetical protein